MINAEMRPKPRAPTQSFVAGKPPPPAGWRLGD